MCTYVTVIRSHTKCYGYLQLTHHDTHAYLHKTKTLNLDVHVGCSSFFHKLLLKLGLLESEIDEVF